LKEKQNKSSEEKMKRILLVLMALLMAFSVTVAYAQDEPVEEAVAEEAVVEEAVVEEAVVEAEEAEEAEALTAVGRDLMVGLNVGILSPAFSQNLDMYATGFGGGLDVCVPGLLDLGVATVEAGLNIGFAAVGSDVDSREAFTAINVGVYGAMNLSSLIPVEGLYVAPKAGLGFYMLGDGSGIGVNGGVKAAYAVAPGISVGLDITGHLALTDPIDTGDASSALLTVGLAGSYVLPNLLPF
jgi:hypothetical protein